MTTLNDCDIIKEIKDIIFHFFDKLSRAEKLHSKSSKLSRRIVRELSLTFNHKVLGSNLSQPDERSNRESSRRIVFTAFI